MRKFATNKICKLSTSQCYFQFQILDIINFQQLKFLLFFSKKIFKLLSIIPQIISSQQNLIKLFMKFGKIKLVSFLWLFSWVTTIFSSLALTFSLIFTRFKYNYNDFQDFAANPCQNINKITSLHFEYMDVYDILIVSLISIGITLHILLILILTGTMFGKIQNQIGQRNQSQSELKATTKKFNLKPENSINDQESEQSISQKYSNQLNNDEIVLQKCIAQLLIFISFIVLLTALGHQIRIFVQIFKSQSCMDSKMTLYQQKMYPQIVVLILSCIFCGLQLFILFIQHITTNKQQVYLPKNQKIKNKKPMKIKMKYKTQKKFNFVQQDSRFQIMHDENIPSRQKLQSPKDLTVVMEGQKSSSQQLIVQEEEPIQLLVLKVNEDKKSNYQKDEQQIVNYQKNNHHSNYQIIDNERTKQKYQNKHEQLSIQQQWSRMKNYKIFELDLNEQSNRDYHTISESHISSSQNISKSNKRRRIFQK